MPGSAALAGALADTDGTDKASALNIGACRPLRCVNGADKLKEFLGFPECGSPNKWIRKAGDKLDEIGVAAGTGFLVEAAKMRLDRCRRDAKRLRHLRHTTYFNDAKENAQLGRCELVGLGDCFWRRRCIESGLVDKRAATAA